MFRRRLFDAILLAHNWAALRAFLLPPAADPLQVQAALDMQLDEVRRLAVANSKNSGKLGGRSGHAKGTAAHWKKVADTQMQEVFTMTDRDDKDIRKMAEVYSDDLAEDVLEPAQI